MIGACHTVSNPAQLPEDRHRFVVGSEQPVRPYAVAAACSLVAALALVAGLIRDITWLALLALALLALALALVAAAIVLRNRYRTTLVTEKTTLTLVNGRRRRILRWSEIADVTLDGSRLIFSPVESGRPEVVLVDPRQTAQPMFAEMLDVLRRRLDASRGYGS